MPKQNPEVAAEEPRRVRRNPGTYAMQRKGDERTSSKKDWTDVTEAIAQVVRYGLAKQTWFNQQEIINEIRDNHKVKALDEKRRSEPRFA